MSDFPGFLAGSDQPLESDAALYKAKPGLTRLGWRA
jgi:hypothetical protein